MKEELETSRDSQTNLLLQQQNRLLEQQNKLLAELIQQRQNHSDYDAPPKLPDDEKILVEDLFHDEIRDGFLVTSHLKRLWNVLLNMLGELDRICKKHDIRYFAIGGTLLGAARHKGFIPWDDDLDVIMFRPDYEKFKRVVEDELKDNPRYKMWYWYNHHLETDPENVDSSILELPFISKEQRDLHPNWAPFFPLMRILDKRTTYFQDDRINVHYAAWIDIFCLDPCLPIEDSKAELTFHAARRILRALTFPEEVLENIRAGVKMAIPNDKLLEFLKLPFKMKALTLESFLAENFTETPYVCELAYFTTKTLKYSYKTKCFEQTTYLPFEKIKIPCPAEFDEVLTDRYGNWREIPDKKKKHAAVFTVDIPYEEFFKKVNVNEVI